MLISSLQKMEKIVGSSSDLEWDGWNVVRYTRSSNAEYAKDGAYRNGSWYKKKIFSLTEKGWDVPESIGNRDAQVEG